MCRHQVAARTPGAESMSRQKSPVDHLTEANLQLPKRMTWTWWTSIAKLPDMDMIWYSFIKPPPCPVQSHHSLPVHAPVAICPSDSSDLSHCCLLLHYLDLMMLAYMFTPCGLIFCFEIPHTPGIDLIKAIPYWRNQLRFEHYQLNFNCSSARYFSSNSALKTCVLEIGTLTPEHVPLGMSHILQYKPPPKKVERLTLEMNIH